MKTLSNLNARAKRLLAITALFALLLALCAPAQIRPSSTLGAEFPLYVTNYDANAIVKVDSAGAQSVFASGGNLSGPHGLAFSRGAGQNGQGGQQLIVKLNDGSTHAANF
jgi:hypothetical protein